MGSSVFAIFGRFSFLAILFIYRCSFGKAAHCKGDIRDMRSGFQGTMRGRICACCEIKGTFINLRTSVCSKSGQDSTDPRDRDDDVHSTIVTMAPGFMQRASMVIPVSVRTEDESLTLDDEAILESIEVDLEKVSPAATKAIYGPGQREYREWWLQRAIKDGKVALEELEDPSRRALEYMKR